MKSVQTVCGRVLLLLLALIMASGAVACGKKKNGNSNGTEPPPEQEKDPLPDMTFEHTDFTFMLRDYVDYINDIAITELGETFSSVDEAVYKRNERVMDRFHVILKFARIEEKAIRDTVTTASLGGTDSYDVVVGSGRDVFVGVMANQFLDWNELEYVDLSQNWWSRNAMQAFSTPGGKLYAMNGDLSYLLVGSSNCMYFNKTLIANAGLRSPYELVEDEEWTLAAFMELAKDVDATLTNRDVNEIATGEFGYATQRWRGPFYAIYSSGGRGLVKSNDGTYSIGFSDERVVNAFASYKEFLFNSNVAFYGDSDASLFPVRSAFSEGRVAFLDDNVKSAMQFTDTEVDFGIVPWPKYEKADDYAVLVGSGTNTFAVLRNTSADNLVRISVILEAMAYYGSQNVITEYFDTVLSFQAVRDDKSYYMLQLIREKASFDFAAYANFGGIPDIGRLVIEQPEKYGTSISTAVSVLESKVMADLEDWYALDRPAA